MASHGVTCIVCWPHQASTSAWVIAGTSLQVLVVLRKPCACVSVPDCHMVWRLPERMKAGLAGKEGHYMR